MLPDGAYAHRATSAENLSDLAVIGNLDYRQRSHWRSILVRPKRAAESTSNRHGEEALMRARRLLEGSVIDPQSLALLSKAFDEAWNSISHQYATASEVEEARLELAQSVLAVASFHGDDIEALKRNALANMTMKHQASRGSSEPKPG